MATPLSANELNAIAKQSGYIGGQFSSVGLPPAITSKNTQATPVVNLTPPVDKTNYAGILANAQTQALGIQQQIGQMTQATTPSGAKVNPQTGEMISGPEQEKNPVLDYIKSITAVSQPSSTQTYNNLYAKSGLEQQKTQLAEKARLTQEAQGRLGNISAQLQALNAEATAIPIQMQQDSVGRGRTAGGIAPLQADELRKVALRAIPLQAQAYLAQAEVANAQGQQQLAQDLYTQAEQTLNKQFELQMADSERQYNFQTNLVNKVYEFANSQEQRQLDALKTKQTQDFQAQQADIKYQRDLQLEKIKNSSKTIPGQISPTTQSIINNPSLFDDLTPTVRGQVIAELQAGGYETTNLGVKGLSDTAIQSIAQTQKALSDLTDLKSKIEGKTNMLGPITGLAALNPYSQARQLQADVDRVRQTVGKALEGGVLRKEDEEKYKKILATLTDTPETASYKIDALISSIQRDIENYKSLQQSSGRSIDVGASLQKKGAVTPVTELRTKYNY